MDDDETSDAARARIEDEVGEIHRLFGAYLGRVNGLEVRIDGMILSFFVPAGSGPNERLRSFRPWILAAVGLSRKLVIPKDLLVELDLLEDGREVLSGLRRAVTIRNNIAHSFVEFDVLDRFMSRDREVTFESLRREEDLALIRTTKTNEPLDRAALATAIEDLDGLNGALRDLQMAVDAQRTEHSGDDI